MISVLHSPSIWMKEDYKHHDLNISASMRTSRLIRMILLVPSRPMLISRSRSSEDPRLKAGDGGPEGSAAPGDIAGEYGKLSPRTDACLRGFLASLFSSSSVS